MDWLDYIDLEDSYERKVASAEALYEYEREKAQLKYLQEKEKENNGKRN